MNGALVPIQNCTVDMIRIKCPYCGERDHSEFTYGGDASIQYPSLDGTEKEWVEAIFFRKNIFGKQLETWHHANGCRMWLEVERSTKTHEIYSVKPCHPEMKKVFADLPEAINNTVLIAQRCTFLVESTAPILPPFDCGNNRTEKEELIVLLIIILYLQYKLQYFILSNIF